MTSRFKTILLSAVVFCSAGAVQASAATIDFNGNPNDTYFRPVVTSGGFVATGNVNEGGVPLGTNTAIDDVGPSNGTVHLDSWTNYSSNSIWTLTKAGGEAFSLNAFDFASAAYDGYSAATSLTLTGRLANKSSVTQTFSPVAGGFQTFAVSPAFSNVMSVTFNAFGDRNRSAFDNIRVDETTVSAAPEPATWAMMILGFGFAGVALRRRVKASEVNFTKKVRAIAAS